MFKIRGEEGASKYSGAALHQRLETFYKGAHVTIEERKARGMLMCHYVSVTADGKPYESYGKQHPLNFIRLEVLNRDEQIATIPLP